MPNSSATWPIVPTYRRRGVPPLRDANRHARLLSRIEATGGVGVQTDPWGGIRIHGSGELESQWAFGYSLSGSVCTVYAGTIRVLGKGNYAVAQTDVTLSGATEWVFAWCNAAYSSTGVSHQSTEPTSTPDNWRFPLLYFTATDGIYSLSRRLWRGDVIAMLPVGG